jgi:hypothetical protein
VQLRQRGRLIGHRAQHQHGDGGIEAAVFERQPVGDRIDDRDRPAARVRRLDRLRAQVRLRLDRDQLGDRVGVVREVGPAPRADLDHPAAQAGERLAPVVALHISLARRQEGRDAGEQRMLHLCGHPSEHTVKLAAEAPEITQG